MNLKYRSLAVLALGLAACAPAPAADLPAPEVSTLAPQVEAATQAPPGEANAATEEAMHIAETQSAGEARVMASEEARHLAETQSAEETMHMAETEQAAQPAPALLAGAFVKEEVSVTGSYTLDPATGQLVFSEDFLVSTGPNLHVILSGASDLSVDYVTFSQMVTGAPFLELGALASPSGSQSYVVPADTDLSQFNTVVVWCEDFDVAFAAAPLAQ